jgi:hypothetical protein
MTVTKLSRLEEMKTPEYQREKREFLRKEEERKDAYFKDNKFKINMPVSEMTIQQHDYYLYMKGKQYRKGNFDESEKLKTNIRSLIYQAMKKGGYKKGSKTENILGCSFEEFKIHIENKFTRGMTWKNMGKWHFDHIFPTSKAKNEKHLIELNHYTNFQPLWGVDNIRKGNKLNYKKPRK